MARAYESHHLVADPLTSAHIQTADLATERVVVLTPQCTAVMLGARGSAGTVNVTFDGTTPSATNGIGIIVGAQPVFFPLGRHAGSPTNDVRALGAAGQFLDVLQLA
jgi:hypothetical protein